MVANFRYICRKCKKVYEPIIEEFPGPTECECGSKDFEKFPWKFFEQLAALEHDQWVEWSKAISEVETLSPERLARWKTLWVPYDQLLEHQKESDRKFAARVFELVRKELKRNV